MSTETKERRPPLDTPAAADYLNVLPSYLERLRCTGDGPVFVKRNGLVRYDPDDLDVWFEGGKQRSTSHGLQLARGVGPAGSGALPVTRPGQTANQS
jgi:hypothetical protein